MTEPPTPDKRRRGRGDWAVGRPNFIHIQCDSAKRIVALDAQVLGLHHVLLSGAEIRAGLDDDHRGLGGPHRTTLQFLADVLRGSHRRR